MVFRLDPNPAGMIIREVVGLGDLPKGRNPRENQRPVTPTQRWVV